MTKAHSLALYAVSSLLIARFAIAQIPSASHQPWEDRRLPPEQRAEMVLQQMTLDEKIAMLHGTGQPGTGILAPEGRDSNGGAGYMVGVPRLAIPGLQMADAAYGVTKSGTTGRYSTALPSNMALAATWDPAAALRYGSLIGRELRAQGYNMTLGGGVDLARELRNGRNFEYGGEDPLLAGTMIGSAIRGLQAEHVVGDLKHYAMNDQESGRNAVDEHIDERSLRETDLLAFQIALREAKPGAVMCSYNRVNGDFACENQHLLTDVLRTDWHFKGFVVSDWQGTHSTVKASHAGLDHEEPDAIFYGQDYRKAVLDGRISQQELDEHVRRMLYAEFASGVADDPAHKSVVDVEGGLRLSQQLAEESIVLLKNEKQLLPLRENGIHRIAVIGSHADIAMISGGGSAQVDPPAGNAIMPSGQGGTHWMDKIWFPTSPLQALKEAFPAAQIEFSSGDDPAEAAAIAKRCDVTIVLAWQWESEAMDLASLSLPERQDELIERVAAANPRTVVVLETGSAVTMPWASRTPAIVEAWYGGSHAAQALVRVLTGKTNPAGKLPITFPMSEADLPHRTVKTPPPASTEDFYGPQGAERDHAGLPPFTVDNTEGLKVGYKWYQAAKTPVLFPFGFGLSYTSFAFSNLKAQPDGKTVSLFVTNTGSTSGSTVAQVYVALPAGTEEPPLRLAGWARVTLAPSETREVSISIDPLLLSIFNTGTNAFQIVAGTYRFRAGSSSEDLPLSVEVNLALSAPDPAPR